MPIKLTKRIQVNVIVTASGILEVDLHVSLSGRLVEVNDIMCGRVRSQIQPARAALTFQFELENLHARSK